MDAAGMEEGHYAGMTVPAFDMVYFPQWVHLDTPAPFDGTECPPEEFLLQWQFYFERLSNASTKRHSG